MACLNVIVPLQTLRFLKRVIKRGLGYRNLNEVFFFFCSSTMFIGFDSRKFCSSTNIQADAFSLVSGGGHLPGGQGPRGN